MSESEDAGKEPFYWVDFWKFDPDATPRDIDNRAVAESEIVAIIEKTAADPEYPLIFVNGDTDWLDSALPPEWVADMLATMERYPTCRFHLHTQLAPHWQSRMRKVAALDSEGGKIAERWLDGIAPVSILVSGPNAHTAVLNAIPARRRPRKPAPDPVAP